MNFSVKAMLKSLSAKMLYVGPGGLRAPCVLVCLRAPCVAWPLLLPSFSLSFFFLLAQAAGVLACAMRSLAIVITIVRSSSFFLFFFCLKFTYPNVPLSVKKADIP